MVVVIVKYHFTTCILYIKVTTAEHRYYFVKNDIKIKNKEKLKKLQYPTIQFNVCSSTDVKNKKLNFLDSEKRF